MTALPINYEQRPWKEKYIDQETPMFNRWFVFGQSRDGKTVDLSDGDSDIIIKLPRHVAQDIIEARDLFIDKILKHLSNFEDTDQEK